MSSGFIIHLSTIIAIYSLLAVSFNLALGFTGLINLGHIAFYGIGAYTSALLSMSGVPILPAIIMGGIFAAFVSYFLSFAINKVKGDYLAMSTLSFAFVVHNTLLNWESVTFGSLGVTGIERPFGLNENYQYLIFVLLVVILSILLINKILNSPFGNLLQAVRDDEVLLRTMGKNTFHLKIKSLSLSSFFAGIAGGLFAHFIGYIHPDNFNLEEVIILLTIVIVGGLASIKGSIIATIIIVLLPELIRLLNVPSSILGPTRKLIYAVVLVSILMYHSRGLFGKVDLE